MFCHTSYSAFTAVAYFAYDLPNTDTFDTVFVLGKGRVAPLKQHTRTILEHQAAVLGTRIAKIVDRESTLPITQLIYYSEGSTIIQWIRKSHKRLQIFITKPRNISCTSVASLSRRHEPHR